MDRSWGRSTRPAPYAELARSIRGFSPGNFRCCVYAWVLAAAFVVSVLLVHLPRVARAMFHKHLKPEAGTVVGSATKFCS